MGLTDFEIHGVVGAAGYPTEGLQFFDVDAHLHSPTHRWLPTHRQTHLWTRSARHLRTALQQTVRLESGPVGHVAGKHHWVVER